MSTAAAPAPLDFAALLSKNYQPARVSRLIPREAYKEEETNDQPKKEDNSRFLDDDQLAAAQEAEASKLAMQLVSKTPIYSRHVHKSKPSEVEEIDGRLPKPPMHEWETLPSALHAVELDDWEKKIQWDGLKDDDDKPVKKFDASSLLGQRRNLHLDALVFDNSNISWDGSPTDTMEKARRLT